MDAFGKYAMEDFVEVGDLNLFVRSFLELCKPTSNHLLFHASTYSLPGIIYVCFLAVIGLRIVTILF